VLDADIRHLTIVDDRSGRHPYHHLLHLVRLEGPLLEHDLQRIERALDGRSHGPFLDAGPRDLVALSWRLSLLPCSSCVVVSSVLSVSLTKERSLHFQLRRNSVPDSPGPRSSRSGVRGRGGRWVDHD